MSDTLNIGLACSNFVRTALVCCMSPHAGNCRRCHVRKLRRAEMNHSLMYARRQLQARC